MTFHLVIYWMNCSGNTLSINAEKQKAILMFKTLSGLTPQYLEEMFSSRIGHYTLRHSNRKLFIPKPNTDYLKHSFSYSGASLWNSLPKFLRLSTSLMHFKTNLEYFIQIVFLTPTRQPGRTVLFHSFFLYLCT